MISRTALQCISRAAADEVYSIELSPEFVALGTQVIPNDQYTQLHHVLVQVPTAVGTATVNSVRIFFRLQYIKVKNALGMSLTQMDKQIQSISAIEHMRAAAKKKKMQKGDPDGESDQGTGSPLTDLHEKMRKRIAITLDPRSLQQPGSGHGATDTSSDKPKSRGTNAASETTETSPSTSTASTAPSSPPTAASVLSAISSPPPQPSGMSVAAYANDMTIALRMFFTTLMQSLVSAKTEIEPRGAFFVLGQVEVSGDRGRVKCDVKAAYDPKAAKYIYVKTTVKHFWELEQAAKGGP